jgi:hypothetical protein
LASAGKPILFFPGNTNPRKEETRGGCRIQAENKRKKKEEGMGYLQGPAGVKEDKF